jgi:hypothetical protein
MKDVAEDPGVEGGFLGPKLDPGVIGKYEVDVAPGVWNSILAGDITAGDCVGAGTGVGGGLKATES